MSVLLYQDYVHNNVILYHRLCADFGADYVILCDADDIDNGALEKARLFVMPGGADLYYCEKLGGAGNKAIRTFVEKGGTYLGICAGAYYGCAAIAWAKDEKTPICGARELGFYKGMAIGPIYEFIEEGDFYKSWDAVVTVEGEEGGYPAFYSGGPIFEGDKDAVILARYRHLPGQPAAIVECRSGAGKAILCSPHIEYDALSYRKTIYKHGNASYKWQLDILEKMKKADEKQEALWHLVLKKAMSDKKQDHET
ncbi:MAG: biotin--protein ligase [Alphaproteobacteria bacterium CG_4_9_14_3_um_filter_47_13]|nr:MAG: biotin--protein ligase [Alphaproteobacteria bacterium CG_4_9_14_3_um_filter_47_13]